MNNTPQHVIMAQSSSRVQRLAEPVKTAFAAPVRAARSPFGSDEEPTRTQQVKRRKPVETVETPAPVSKPTPAPVVQANSGYLKAPSTGMVTVAGSRVAAFSAHLRPQALRGTDLLEPLPVRRYVVSHVQTNRRP